MQIHLREIREAQGLTLAEVAKRTGMSIGYLSQVERGLRRINSQRLSELAQAFHVQVQQLIEEDELDPEFRAHLAVLQELSPEDRRAVLHHAQALVTTNKINRSRRRRQ